MEVCFLWVMYVEQAETSAIGRSLAQRIPTVCMCDLVWSGGAITLSLQREVRLRKSKWMKERKNERKILKIWKFAIRFNRHWKVCKWSKMQNYRLGWSEFLTIAIMSSSRGRYVFGSHISYEIFLENKIRHNVGSYILPHHVSIYNRRARSKWRIRSAAITEQR